MKPSEKFDTHRVLRIAESVKPLLRGHGPAMQGAVLAELLSIWLAGHPPELRGDLLKHHLRIVRQLVPVNAKALRGEGERKH
jgi:hypothetical protein